MTGYLQNFHFALQFFKFASLNLVNKLVTLDLALLLLDLARKFFIELLLLQVNFFITSLESDLIFNTLLFEFFDSVCD